jgi:hypothetical protein
MGAGRQNSLEGKMIEAHHKTSMPSVGQFYCRQVQTTIIEYLNGTTHEIKTESISHVRLVYLLL